MRKNLKGSGEIIYTISFLKQGMWVSATEMEYFREKSVMHNTKFRNFGYQRKPETGIV